MTIVLNHTNNHIPTRSLVTKIKITDDLYNNWASCMPSYYQLPCYLNFHMWCIVLFRFHNSGDTTTHFFPVNNVLFYSGHCDHVFLVIKECFSLLVSNQIDHPIICAWHQLQSFWVMHLNCTEELLNCLIPFRNSFISAQT